MSDTVHDPNTATAQTDSRLSVGVHYADCCQNPKNCNYPHYGVARNEEEFARMVSRDHVFFAFENDYRNLDNFLYSDGIPEANDIAQEQFGTDRMVNALNINPNGTPEEILANVKNEVNGFVSDAVQFDDLTMLCLQYNGK